MAPAEPSTGLGLTGLEAAAPTPAAAGAALVTATPMQSLPAGYTTLVIGASGAIGCAFAERLRADPRCGAVHALGRHTEPAIDLLHEDRIAAAAQQLALAGPLHLIVVASGMLHSPTARPEKRLADLSAAAMQEVLHLNTIAPALVLKHFAPLLDRQRSVMALLSAKVGSIGDNRLGGWYSYRASKAALNMLVKTASIELRRTHPGAVLAALHPGTVKSTLSRPFRGDQIGQDPAHAVAAMLRALDSLAAEDSGCFLAWDGQRLPW
jgi:NAD(P)-dependent dehydrogenase (short-subunit alcohol dehydrogenase family)